jgi:hypothetical protein
MNVFISLRERDYDSDPENPKLPPQDCVGGRTCSEPAYYTVRLRDQYDPAHPLHETENNYCDVHARARVNKYLKERT